MNEIFQPGEHEVSAEQPLDKNTILDRLFELAGELGIDIEEVDVEFLLGEDDNDFLGNLTSLALENGIDPEELFERLGIELE